jgi:hypothetical protein
VLGSFLIASLFDTQAGKEVWRNSASTKYGARFWHVFAGFGEAN